MIFHLYAFCFIVEGFSFFVPFHPSELGLKLSLGRLLFFLFMPIFFLFLIKNGRKIYVKVDYFFKILLVIFIIYISFFVAFINGLLNTEFSNIDVVGGLYSSWIMLFVSMIVHAAVYILIPLILVSVDKQQFKKTMAFWLATGLGVGLAVGYVDFFAAAFGLDLLARDMVDFVHVGVRWHGLFGEPRDAAVTLIVWLFLLSVFRDGYSQNPTRASKNLIFIMMVFLAFVLTLSASGLIGLVCGTILYLAFSRNYSSRFSYLVLFISLVGLYLALVEFEFLDDRVFKYFSLIASVPREEFIGVIPPLLVGQSHNIYPFYIFLDRMIYDHFAMLFGSGFGSVILTNMDLLRFRAEAAIPAASLPIILNDFGMLGVGYLFWAFLSCRRRLLNSPSMLRDQKFLFFCLAVSAALFHKTPYFYFLIFFAVIYCKREVGDK